MTVGTQAAVLAGLDITLFVEFSPPGNAEWGVGLFVYIPRLLKFIYYVMIVSAFCANMMVVSHTTALSVLGAGLALRGPDGSMVTATDGLYEERKSVFYIFGFGLACTLSSVVICVWLILHWEAASICMCIALWTCHTVYQNYKRIVKRFVYDESETVNFDDIFYGPAAISVVKSGISKVKRTLVGASKKKGDDYDSSPVDSPSNPSVKRRVVTMNGEHSMV